jgi:membrane-associated phospholipid phosphatase
MVIQFIYEKLLIFARLSPVFYFLIPTIEYIKTYNEKALKYLKGFVFSEILNKILKYLFKMPRPEKSKNCSILEKIPFLNKSYGMPSGHSQAAWYTCIFVSLYIWYNTKYSRTIKLIAILIFFIINMFISYSRVLNHCHTFSQIIFGGIIGTNIGYYMYHTE